MSDKTFSGKRASDPAFIQYQKRAFWWQLNKYQIHAIEKVCQSSRYIRSSDPIVIIQNDSTVPTRADSILDEQSMVGDYDFLPHAIEADRLLFYTKPVAEIKPERPPSKFGILVMVDCAPTERLARRKNPLERDWFFGGVATESSWYYCRWTSCETNLFSVCGFAYGYWTLRHEQ